MLDNQLLQLIINTINANETFAGLNVAIIQSAQPTQQGVATEPTAYIQKIADERIGFPFFGYVWNATSSTEEYTQLQQYGTTFQMGALATQDPNNINAYTASDIVNLISGILQSAIAVAAFEAQGVGIQKVSTISNPYFLDDRERFEAFPTFTFIMTHKQILTSTTPVISKTEVDLYQI